MARRVNYGFEKFQKEAKRKKKQAEKLEKKRLKKESAANPDGSVPAADEVPAEEPAPTTTDDTTNS
jgi:hypothetical protein